MELFPRGLGRITPAAITAVAAGGVLGTTGRWGIAEIWHADAGHWPWATLIVNVIGSFAIGLVASRLVIGTVAADFAITGVLGGFTTYSSFAVEVNDLVGADRLGLAALYAVITIAAGLLAVLLAVRLARRAGVLPP